MCNGRGTPEEMIADNGTNFVSGDQAFRELITHDQTLHNGELGETLMRQKVKWTTISTTLKWSFQTMVKAAKRAILAILANANVNNEN